jgi:hypothetical protein
VIFGLFSTPDTKCDSIKDCRAKCAP